VGTTDWLEGPARALSACGAGKRRTKERQIFYKAKEGSPPPEKIYVQRSWMHLAY